MKRKGGKEQTKRKGSSVDKKGERRRDGKKKKKKRERKMDREREEERGRKEKGDFGGVPTVESRQSES